MTRGETRRLWLFGLAWASVTSLPYVQAAVHPPRGHWFTGFLAFQDDFFQYLSFSEQALHGRLFFENKFALFEHGPFLFNPEWLISGLLAAPLGGHLALATHAAALVAALALVFTVVKVLEAGGARGTDILWSLALVMMGGGLGYWRLWRGIPFNQIPDLGLCLFPWALRIDGGPHALTALALLLAAILCFASWLQGTLGRREWILLATALGLVRAFDLILFSAVAAGLIVLSGLRRDTLARLLDLLWLAPVFLYEFVTLKLHPAFAVWSSDQNTVALPPLGEMAFAFGPALVCALLGSRRRATDPLAATIRRALWLLVAVVLVALASGASFALQFANCLGGIVLLLAALSLPQRGLPIATLVLCPSSLILFATLMNPPLRWFPPDDYLAAIEVVANHASASDRLLGPPDLSRMMAAFTPCRVVAGHRVLTPDFDQRLEELDAFYGAAAPASWRQAYLRAIDAEWVIRPGGAALLGASWDRVLQRPTLEVWHRRVKP